MNSIGKNRFFLPSIFTFIHTRTLRNSFLFLFFYSFSCHQWKEKSLEWKRNRMKNIIQMEQLTIWMLMIIYSGMEFFLGTRRDDNLVDTIYQQSPVCIINTVHFFAYEMAGFQQQKWIKWDIYLYDFVLPPPPKKKNGHWQLNGNCNDNAIKY